MPFDNIDRQSPSGAPYPEKSALDQGVGNFVKGFLNPQAFPAHHQGLGTEQDSWAGRTGGRLKTAMELPVDVMTGAAAGGFQRSSPQTLQKINALAKLAKAGNIDAKAELASHFGPMFTRIGNRVRPTKQTVETRASAQDIAQQFHRRLLESIRSWDPARNDNFEAYVMSNAQKAPGMASGMERRVSGGGLDKMQKEILRLSNEYDTRYGAPVTNMDEVKRDGFIARRIQGDWTQIADQMPEREARQTMLKQAYQMVKDARNAMAQISTTDVNTDPRAKIQGVHRQIPEGLTFKGELGDDPAATAAQRSVILHKAKQAMDPVDARLMELAQQVDPATGRTMSNRKIAEIMTSEGHKMNHQRVNQRLARARKIAQDTEKGQGFAGKDPGTPPPIGGGSDAPDPWGTKPTRTRPLTPRELGTNPRAQQAIPNAGDPATTIGRLGLKYDGATEFNGQTLHWYTDPATQSTGVVRSPEEVADLERTIVESRAKYKRPIGGGSDAPQSPAQYVDQSVDSYRRFVNRGGVDKEPDPSIVRQLQNPRQHSDAVPGLDIEEEMRRIQHSSRIPGPTPDDWMRGNYGASGPNLYLESTPGGSRQPMMLLKEDYFPNNPPGFRGIR